MRLDKVDLNLFVIFDAIYRERGVTRVAQQLNLTQPAVSNSLARLRQTFDDQLFVRTPEGMAPTPVADNLIGDVRRALLLLEKSISSNARFDPGSAETVFKLGMNDLAALLVLPGLQQSASDQAPGITISSYYVDRDRAVEELRSGALDLLLDSPQLNARELGQQPVASLPYVVAMREEHPLAGGPVSLDDYIAARHVHVSSRKRGRGQADVALHAAGLSRTVAMRVQHYTVAAAITASSDLLWTVPQAMVQPGALHVAELPIAVAPLEFNLFWSRSATDDPASQWLRGLVMDLFSQ